MDLAPNGYSDPKKVVVATFIHQGQVKTSIRSVVATAFMATHDKQTYNVLSGKSGQTQ